MHVDRLQATCVDVRAFLKRTKVDVHRPVGGGFGEKTTNEMTSPTADEYVYSMVVYGFWLLLL